MSQKKILIIDKHRFGELTDSYKWCMYLKAEYLVTIVCFASSITQNCDGLKLKACPMLKNRIIRGIVFLLTAIWHILWHRGAIIVIYFEKCHILKRLFSSRKMLLDIRTLSIAKNPLTREIQDEKIRHTCILYDYVTAISSGVANKINLPQKKINILPLGADIISKQPKQYSLLKLLYVGTFNGRNIEDTINGIAIFCKKHPEIHLTYDIIGDGHNNELEIFKKLINQYNLENIIKLHGRLSPVRLKPFFDSCNVGISYIPITDYYNFQPPTKTFEYALSGLYTIATATEANKEIINDNNGMLINDSAEAFANAIEAILSKNNFDEIAIRNSLIKYNWKEIVSTILSPIISKLQWS